MLKDLLTFIIMGISGSEGFTVEESEDETGKINLEVKADPSIMGILIGKGGNTIKAITTILRVRGRIEDKLVNVNISESSS